MSTKDLERKLQFIDEYKHASNAATGSKFDSNANITTKNIATLQCELGKKDLIDLNRAITKNYLKDMYGEELADKFDDDLKNHIIYSHDESSIMPYCCSISLYPFLLNGLKDLGGSSGAPQHANGFIGGLINLVFLVAGQFAGACMYKDQRILVRINGISYSLTSKELFEKFNKNQKHFKTLTDTWDYCEVNNVEVFEDGKWIKLNKVMRRPYNGDIYNVSTKSGLNVRTSQDHKYKVLYKNRDFEIKASDLKINDTVYANREFNDLINKNSDDYKIGQIIGLIAGDGHLTDTCTEISINTNQLFIADFLDDNLSILFKKFNIEEPNHTRLTDKRTDKVINYYVGSTKISAIIKSYFKDGCYDTFTKNVDISDKSLDWQLGFLDGLLTADGCYSKGHCMRLSLTNKSLLETVKLILNNIYLNTRISSYIPKNRPNNHTMYNCHIPLQCYNLLNLILKKPCYSSMMSWLSREKHNNTKTMYYSGPMSGNSKTRLCSVRSSKQYDLMSDVVTNISTFTNDDEYVYEIETETHWYNCGGLITHNCAIPEFLTYFDHFIRKDFGQDYIEHLDEGTITLRKKIEDWFQQFVYSVNQPAGARNYQSPFTNIAYFDKYYFESVFKDFVFPDGDEPCWETTKELQKMFMKWFNKERTKEILTFPVETFNILVEDGKYKDEETADFIAECWACGHSFFCYQSDSVDALASCCFSGDTKTLVKSSDGVYYINFKDLYDAKWRDMKHNFTIFHNGSWVKGKTIKLPNRPMYKIVTTNNKEIVVSDNHLNVTLRGDVETKNLTVDDYLMFNCKSLDSISEKDEHLTYEQGFVVGAFLGDGSFDKTMVLADNTKRIYGINFSQNINKYKKCIDMVDIANKQLGGKSKCKLGKIKNNVYPVRISSRVLVDFIIKWTNWYRGTYSFNKELNLDCLLQSKEFRKGILDGWYNTDGGNSNRCYTTSKVLADDMEVLITSLGMFSVINLDDTSKRDLNGHIRGERINHNYPVYCVRWYDMKNKRSMKNVYKVRNNSTYFKIKSIESIEYNDDIYCFEMKNDEEPYFTLPNGIITHNCRLRNAVEENVFSYTLGAGGIETGSKKVITLNLNRIVQDWYRENKRIVIPQEYISLSEYIEEIVKRVHKYLNAWNQKLWDDFNDGILTVYSAGFIDLDKQYLTVGVNGFVEAAEFLQTVNDTKYNNIKVDPNNEKYQMLAHDILGTIKRINQEDRTEHCRYNTEFVPAENAAGKLYNWDKKDGYIVPKGRVLYNSYFYVVEDETIDPIKKFYYQGNGFATECDGGVALHNNLNEHLTKKQYRILMDVAVKAGCNYWTFNIPMYACDDELNCGYVSKYKVDKCPKCGSSVTPATRIIGYLKKVSNFSELRQKEFKSRYFAAHTEVDN